MISLLRREGFDWAIDLEHWPRLSALLAYATGAPMRIGFSTTGQYRHLLFTETVPHIQGRHEVRNFLSLAAQLNCSVQELGLEAWWREKERAWVREVLAEEGISLEKPIIVLHPEAGRRGEPRRRWPQGRYAALANALVARYDAQIVLTGAPDEVAVSEEIAERTKHRAVVLCWTDECQPTRRAFCGRDVGSEWQLWSDAPRGGSRNTGYRVARSHKFRAMGSLES